MHDPQTLVWRVRIPLPWFSESKYRINKEGEKVRRSFRTRSAIRLVDIWHVDPETDGSDDSCCVRKRLGRKHGGLMEYMGGDEARSPWFLRERAKEPQSAADAEALLRGAFWHVARCTRLNRWSPFHKRITFDRCASLASELLHNTIDNVRSSLCLLPGWHTNEPMQDGSYPPEIDIEDGAAMDAEKARPPSDPQYPMDTSEWKRRDRSQAFFRMVLRILSRESARWWQHPRWHFWHWSFQIHAWQWFKRKFIERCSQCSKRFAGSSEVYSSWGGNLRWCALCQRASERSLPAPPAPPENVGTPAAEHEQPWRDEEKSDQNYGRTCLCGAAIRSGGRLVHTCRFTDLGTPAAGGG